MPTTRRPVWRRRTASSVIEINCWHEFGLRVGPDEATTVWTAWEPDDPRWEEAWEVHGERITAEFILRYPGERPWGWWTWSRPDEDLADGETRPEYLHRLGLLDEPELAGIYRRALALINYDRGRDPRKLNSNFIPASAEITLLAQIGLLTAEERAILHL